MALERQIVGGSSREGGVAIELRLRFVLKPSFGHISSTQAHIQPRLVDKNTVHGQASNLGCDGALSLTSKPLSNQYSHP